MVATQETIDKVKEVSSSYKYGFVTELEAEKAPLGLSEDIVTVSYTHLRAHET